MKVFVAASELPKNNPQVLASYPDDSDVPDNVHGTGVMVFTVSADSLVQHDAGGIRIQKLTGDWRERSERAKIFTVGDRLAAMQELLELILKHGADVEKWPAPDRDRQIVIMKRWKP